MNYQEFLTDEQEPKALEKVFGKIVDLLTNGEKIAYIAIQKKPAVNLVPSSIVVTDRRIIFCTPANLGLTTNFDIYAWRDVKEVSFKEGLLGAKFTMVPLSGENYTMEYLPKVQARKLFQCSNQQLEAYREQLRQDQLKKDIALVEVQQKEEDAKASLVTAPPPEALPAPAVSDASVAEDELTQKLKKLKLLFEKQLITKEEYEQKKNDLLTDL